MIHRLATTVSVALLLALALAGAALAKEGMQARLDAPIPADTPPGTTIEVGWTTVVPSGDGDTVAFSGAPVFIALRSPDADVPEALVFGDEFPAGSGHFTASIVVPDGGIAPDGVTIGLRGEMCENGECVRNVMPFELVGDVLTTAVVVAPVVVASAAPAPVAVASAAPVPVADPGSEQVSDTTPWLAIAVAGAALAIVGVLVGVRVGRRRAAVVATSVVASVVLVLAAASGALAKEEGVLVTLDTPIPGDAESGSTIDLAWSMTIEPIDGSAATTPYEATPLIVRVTSRSGVPVDVAATHLGGGRYTAAITVPETGIGALDMGIPTETGGLLLMAEVFDAPPIIRTVGPDQSAAAAAIDPSLPLLAVGIGAALLAGLAAALVARRRFGSADAGQTGTRAASPTDPVVTAP